MGNCGSPIETESGWLVLTHGVGAMRKYCIGAMLLDRDDPSRVIGRLREPLIKPESHEREGYVPNVVYTCGGYDSCGATHPSLCGIGFGHFLCDCRIGRVDRRDELVRRAQLQVPACIGGRDSYIFGTMPIYEFYSPDTNRIYSFFARSLAQGRLTPRCPDNPVRAWSA